MVCHVLPARADIDAGQFQPRQQRDRTDLVLRVVASDTPDLLVVQRQHLGGPVKLQREQGGVPPVVGEHEGVQSGPGRADRAHEVQPLLKPALGQQHMGQCVVGPGLLVAQRDGVASRRFGLRQQVALFPGEGCHAVHVGHIVTGWQGLQRQTQHAGRVAGVEQVVLAELDRGQVTRAIARLFLVQRDGAGQVAFRPGRDRCHEAPLPGAHCRVGQTGLSARNIRCGMGCCLS